ncbi:hypothetical protein [Actinomarinicola tropica]|uniref:Uncharacterized protein n=1 Tax=Actinomarinicola tropica TaxID=2789776 RepID=A0A5Q2RMG0_9ACTN|nr:hypothetical protein [Actinomarinicola tropica]QGG96654.1 hypothetical protein GH723_16980 [Actinomarinicola tropica]
MAFGQAAGPPASAAQITELAELLARAGFDGFREARHPYGLTQRQSNGKFTRGEADELIGRLTDELDEGPEPPAADPTASVTAAESAEPPPSDVTLAFPDELLADELRRRGWTCTPPRG